MTMVLKDRFAIRHRAARPLTNVSIENGGSFPGGDGMRVARARGKLHLRAAMGIVVVYLAVSP